MAKQPKKLEIRYGAGKAVFPPKRAPEGPAPPTDEPSARLADLAPAPGQFRLGDAAARADVKSPQAAWDDFSRVVNSVRGDGVVTADELREVQNLLADVARAQGETTDLSTFFRSVGEGVVDAQRQLDRASATYSDGQPAYATAYRIPKVSAEINFAMTSVTSRGFNVFVAKRESELKNVQQQRVWFDVVAAPAPAELRAESARRTAVLAAGLAASLAMAPAAREQRLGFLDPKKLPPTHEAHVALFKAAADQLILFDFDSGKQFAFVRVVPGPRPAWDAIVIADPGSGAISRYLGSSGVDVRDRDVILGHLLDRLAAVTREYTTPMPT